MSRRIVLAGLCCLALLGALLSGATTVAQSDEAVRLLAWVSLPNSADTKHPHVAADGPTVTVVSNANRQDAHVWTKAAAADRFDQPVRIGAAEGLPPNTTMSVAVGPDRRTYAAWINESQRAVYMRVRGADGAWGPTRLVNRGSPFPVEVEIAVAGDGAIFVAWRDPDRPTSFRRSTDGGISWSPAARIASGIVDKDGFSLVAGPGGRVGAAWTQGFDNVLHIYVGLWNGQGFDRQRITSGADGYSGPTLTFSPTGVPVVAYRGIAIHGGNSGVFFAERQPNGAWPRARLMGGDTLGTVNVLADVDGGLHMVWISRATGAYGVYYATRPVAGAWRGPFMVPAGSAQLYNARAALADAGQRFVHFVAERWSGAKPVVRYGLFQSGFAVAASPTIEGGAERARGFPTVRVSFSGVTGGPTELRWRWDAPPTDTASDSGGWRPFATAVDIPVTAAPAGSAACLPRTLYTQVRSGAAVQREPGADSVVLDASVDVSVSAVNPLLPGAPGGAASAGLALPATTHDTLDAGDPGYTRIPLTWLRVGVLGECSALKDVALGRSASRLSLSYPLGPAGLSALVPLPEPGNIADGPLTFVVEVEDALGNTRVERQTLVVDRKPPVLDPTSPGVLSLSPEPQATILQTISMTGTKVRDDFYPGRGFWGLAVAASRTPVESPTSDERLRWSPVAAPGSGPDVTVRGWSLASSLGAAELTPGDYYVYVRFVDGAGNVSEGALAGKVTLSELTRPRTALPHVRR